MIDGMTYGELVAALKKDLILDLKTDVTLHSATNEIMDPAYIDGTAATASMRTLGSGAQQAAPGNDSRFGTEGSTLPVAPVDGQVFDYIADSANGVEWRFRFRSAISKWVFIGGAALFSEDKTDPRAATASAVATTTTSMGSSAAVTAPFAGDYEIHLTTSCTMNSAQAPQIQVFPVNQTGLAIPTGIDNLRAFEQFSNTAIAQGDIVHIGRATGVAAGTVLIPAFRSSLASTSMSFYSIYLAIRPIKVG